MYSPADLKPYLCQLLISCLLLLEGKFVMLVYKSYTTPPKKSTCAYHLQLHANASFAQRVMQTSLLVAVVIKPGRPILNPPPFHYSTSVQSVPSTKFNNSLPLYLKGDKERKTWRGREKESEKEWSLRVKPSPETPLQHRHKGRKRKSEVKQEKKWQRLVSLD